MLENILKKYSEDINGVIQVGAHIGQQVNLFLKLENVVIHLFEPQKNPLEVLKKYKKYSNIILRDIT